MRRVLISLVFVALSTPVLASDGVLEINQTCALETGCFPGDMPGFPVTIATAGSYRLTGNLQVVDADTTAVEVQTSDVAVDLAGFEIRGVTACSGTPTTCAPTGVGVGVSLLDVALQDGMRVRNGSVTGMGLGGVVVGVRGVVDRVHASQNGNFGIAASDASTVRGCIAALNGNTGLVTGANSTMVDNIASRNASVGITTTEGSSITQSAARGSSLLGIGVGSGSTVSGNSAYENELGIWAGNGSLVRGNATYLNADRGITGLDGVTILDNTSYENGGDGVFCRDGCILRGNNVRSNAGVGLNLGTDSAYRENVVSNNGAAVTGTGVDAGANIIGGVVTSTP